MKSTVKKRYALKLLAWLLALALMGSFSGCHSPSDTPSRDGVNVTFPDNPNRNMPFNGDVTFHDISVTIPDSFIRDSTQSNENAWLFEKGFYKQLIILTQSEITGDTQASLDRYVAYMQEQGADSQRESFLEMDAVLSTYTKDGMFCQEMLFAYGGYFYAVALRGGTQDEFWSLLDTVSVSAENDTITA